MKCIPLKQHIGGHMGMDSCCCGPGSGHQGYFLSKKKKIEMLKKYADSLKEKIEDIEAYIEELSKG